jgi:hypothetical protein
MINLDNKQHKPTRSFILGLVLVESGRQAGRQAVPLLVARSERERERELAGWLAGCNTIQRPQEQHSRGERCLGGLSYYCRSAIF